MRTLTLRLRNDRGTVVDKFHDALDKVGQVVIRLQQRVQIARVTDVLYATRHSFFTLALARVQRLITAMNIALILLIDTVHDCLVHLGLEVVASHARDLWLHACL